MYRKLAGVLLLMVSMAFTGPFDDLLKEMSEEEEELNVQADQLLTFYKVKIPDAHSLLTAYIKKYNAMVKGDFPIEEDIDEEEAEEYLQDQMEEVKEQFEPFLWFYVEYTHLADEEPEEAEAYLKLGKLEAKSRLLGYKIKEAREKKQNTAIA